MSSNECIHAIALTLIPGIGPVWARRLVEAAGSAEQVFARRHELPKLMPGITPRVVNALHCPQAFERANKEYEFVEKNRIACLTFQNNAYPRRLLECDDAPIVLFFKGDTNLNATHIVSMVGTRNASDYGKQLCANFVKDLKTLCPNLLIVSGLAYGIDIHAHRAAVAAQVPTVGVLAHGLDRIYPHAHRKTAIDMLPNGGLLTEYLTGTPPDRFNFVARNRIVAGMCEATVVIESAAKGGSLITADLAGSYHRDCFTFPGRVTDETSRGCNQLIRDNKAALIQSAEDFAHLIGWVQSKKPKKADAVQRSFFNNLTDEEQRVVQQIEKEGSAQINSLVVATNIPVYKMSSLLFELELKGVVQVMVGGMYKICQ